MNTPETHEPSPPARRPRWDPIIPPKPVYPVYHQAELNPVVLLKGALQSLPAGDLTLGLFVKLTPEGTGMAEPPLETGYLRQPVSFGSGLGVNGSVNVTPVTFDFRSDMPAPALIGLISQERVIMRGRLFGSQVWTGPDLEDHEERQVRLLAGAMRLRFS